MSKTEDDPVVIEWLGGGGKWPWASVEKMALRYG